MGWVFGTVSLFRQPGKALGIDVQVPTTMVGTSWRCSTSRSRATSAASEDSGNCGAVTW
jgi:hypothetical protein